MNDDNTVSSPMKVQILLNSQSVTANRIIQSTSKQYNIQCNTKV